MPSPSRIFTSYRVWNAVALLAVIAVNVLAEWLPIGGRTTGQVSDLYPVLITPAGYAFGIWGLIYSLLVAFVIVGLLPSHRNAPAVQAVGPWFMVSCLFNMTWVFLWHYLYITSTVFVMLAFLLTLVVVYGRTRSGGRERHSTAPVTYWFVKLPFSVYLAWVSVAALVNLAVGLKAAGWEAWGIPDIPWAMTLIAVAGLLALVIGSRFKDPVYVLTVVWALVAIGVKQLPDTPTVAYNAWSTAGALLFYALWLMLPGSNRHRAVE